MTTPRKRKRPRVVQGLRVPTRGYYHVTEERPGGFLLPPDGVNLPPGPVQPLPAAEAPLTPELQGFIDRVIVPHLLARLRREQLAAQTAGPTTAAGGATPDAAAGQRDKPASR